MRRVMVVVLGVCLTIMASHIKLSAGDLRHDAGCNSAIQSYSVPLSFTENKGQFDSDIKFRAQNSKDSYLFKNNGVVLLLMGTKNEDLAEQSNGGMKLIDINRPLHVPGHLGEKLAVSVEFLGANPGADIIGLDPLAHKSNYFLGNDPENWHTGVPNYSSILYDEIYPGIDLKYYSNDGILKYDLIVDAGADLSQIRFQYSGVDNIILLENGDLEIRTASGPIYEKKPYIYQIIAGEKKEISGRYEFRGQGVFGFSIDDDYNPRYPIIIDPDVIYSTYLGGDEHDYGYHMAVDGDGYAYITGETYSDDFPTVNAYDPTYNGGGDVFVTKFSTNGSSLVYSTYLGGTGSEHGQGIFVDDDGYAYIAGATGSSDFPTQNAYDPTYNGGGDAFITKLSQNGGSLIYSTYLGGGSSDEAKDIVADDNGYAYITGDTWSSGFPTTQGAYQTSLSGIRDAFVTKLASAGNSLVYSTFLGGTSYEWGVGIAINDSGYAFVIGTTMSTNFPTTEYAYCPDDPDTDGLDVFVTKFSLDASSLIYSTYLGSDGEYDHDYGYGIAVDGDGYAYVTGLAWPGYPTTTGAYDPPYNDEDDAFVTKLNYSGSSLVYSLLLGGSFQDFGMDISVDNEGCASVTGKVMSSDFPTINYLYNQLGGTTDAFITKIGPLGRCLIFSTYWGGSSGDMGHSLFSDNSGYIFVVGWTTSNDFPLENQYQSYQGSSDAFVSKIYVGGCEYVIGDVNGSDSYNQLDITYGSNYFKGGPEPLCDDCCYCYGWFYCGDVNGSCTYNGLDLTYGVAYFKGGPAPVACSDCPPEE